MLSTEDLSEQDQQDEIGVETTKASNKLKSSELINKNKNLLKQDFNRINKIFHTKFN